MMVWREEQLPDALAGDDLSRAAMEQGQRMVLRAGNFLPPHFPTQVDERMESHFLTGDHSTRGGIINGGSLQQFGEIFRFLEW